MTGLKMKCEELANQLNKNLTDSGISDWIGSDGGDPGYQFLTDDDIQQVTNPKVSTENESDNDSDSGDGSNDVPTNGEVTEMWD